jgi:hypothetical protein
MGPGRTHSQSISSANTGCSAPPAYPRAHEAQDVFPFCRDQRQLVFVDSAETELCLEVAEALTRDADIIFRVPLGELLCGHADEITNTRGLFDPNPADLNHRFSSSD